jgi:hypothetical protein
VEEEVLEKESLGVLEEEARAGAVRLEVELED